MLAFLDGELRPFLDRSEGEVVVCLPQGPFLYFVFLDFLIQEDFVIVLFHFFFYLFLEFSNFIRKNLNHLFTYISLILIIITLRILFILHSLSFLRVSPFQLLVDPKTFLQVTNSLLR